MTKKTNPYARQQKFAKENYRVINIYLRSDILIKKYIEDNSELYPYLNLNRATILESAIQSFIHKNPDYLKFVLDNKKKK
tara:strand:- start:110 stop:349 length:240 start_codon:yes stop_codon:yes gene_type:complete